MANEVENEPEEEAQEEIEVVVGDVKEEAPATNVTLTSEEFAALKASGDSAKALQLGLEGLSSKLVPQAQAPAVNAPTETPEEYYAAHADDLFDKDKGGKVLAEYSKRVMEREYGPMFSNVSAQLVATRKELLETRDPMYKKYSSEVEALVKSLPASAQLQPDIYERAWQNVRQKHQPEIEEESVNARVEAAVEKKLKELGIDSKATKGNERPPAYANSAARSGGSAPGSSKRTVRLPDEQTRVKLEREALRKGLDFNDLLRSKGYVD